MMFVLYMQKKKNCSETFRKEKECRCVGNYPFFLFSLNKCIVLLLLHETMKQLLYFSNFLMLIGTGLLKICDHIGLPSMTDHLWAEISNVSRLAEAIIISKMNLTTGILSTPYMFSKELENYKYRYLVCFFYFCNTLLCVCVF